MVIASPSSRQPGAKPHQHGLSDSDIRCLREKHSFLCDFSDSFIRNTSIGDLMKIQSTALKAREIERAREAEDKLAINKAALMSTFTTVKEGRDNRQTVLHPARFLAGAACSSTRLWLAAREAVGDSSFPAVSSYDMGAVGLAGHVSAKGWAELHNLASNKLSVKQFSINNCSSRTHGKKVGEEEELQDVGDFRLALRAMRTAFALALPWNHSVLALEGFFFQTSFCASDLVNVEKKAWYLVKFTDYVLGQNVDRWRDAEPFLTAGELKTAWSSFFGSQPQAAVSAKSKKPGGKQGGARAVDPRIALGICFNFNQGNCMKAAGTCTMKMGRALKHICDFTADPSKPTEVCGKDHARKDVHK